VGRSAERRGREGGREGRREGRRESDRECIGKICQRDKRKEKQNNLHA